MKTTFSKNKLFLGLGFAAAVVAPVAIVVACGDNEDTSEADTQAVILSASDAPASSAKLNDRVLSGLKTVVKGLAGVTSTTTEGDKTKVAEYLATNKPKIDTAAELAPYANFFYSELKRLYALPTASTFGQTEFTKLLSDVGVTGNFTSNVLLTGLKSYGADSTDATASWAAQVKFWDYLFDTTKNYANLKSFITKGAVVTEAQLYNADKVVDAAVGQPSGVTGVTATGLGGEALFTPSTKEYQVRSTAALLSAAVDQTTDAARPLIDVNKLNNIAEFNAVVIALLKFKDASFRPLASFNNGTAATWEALAAQLEKVTYDVKLEFQSRSSDGRQTIVKYTDEKPIFAGVKTASDKLVKLLREKAAPAQTKQLTWASTDFTAAATATPFGEDTLTTAGKDKLKAWVTPPETPVATSDYSTKGLVVTRFTPEVGSTVTPDPVSLPTELPEYDKLTLPAALKDANNDYATGVLGMLPGGLSKEQYTAYVEYLGALATALNALRSGVLEKVYPTSPNTWHFERGLTLNLWNLATYASPKPAVAATGVEEETQASLVARTYLANFFVQALTNQFAAGSYLVPATTPAPAASGTSSAA